MPLFFTVLSICFVFAVMQLLQHCLQLFRYWKSQMCSIFRKAHTFIGDVEENDCRAKYAARSDDMNI